MSALVSSVWLRRRFPSLRGVDEQDVVPAGSSFSGLAGPAHDPQRRRDAGRRVQRRRQGHDRADAARFNQAAADFPFCAAPEDGPVPENEHGHAALA